MTATAHVTCNYGHNSNNMNRMNETTHQLLTFFYFYINLLLFIIMYIYIFKTAFRSLSLLSEKNIQIVKAQFIIYAYYQFI